MEEAEVNIKIMDTLWAFGDSFTESYVAPKGASKHWRTDYINWKGYETKVYPEFVAEKLNLNLVNKSVGGCDNSYIFEEFCKVAPQIQKDDIVIFGWTDVHRFRLYNKENKVGFFKANALDKDGGAIFSEEFNESIYFFTFSSILFVSS